MSLSKPVVVRSPLYRLATFSSVLSKMQHVLLLEACDEGLFWNSRKQLICCVSCTFECVLDVDPLRDHRLISPHCSRIGSERSVERRDLETVEGDDAVGDRRSSLQDTTSDYQDFEREENFLRGELQRYNTKLFKPNFLVLKKREQSFGKHKYISSDDITQFSEAGFLYYEGSIRCFCCGLSIQLHELGNIRDPWTVHAARSRNCRFVQIEKGNGFIESVAEEFGDICSDPVVTKFISRDMCVTLTSMGFNNDDIKKAAITRGRDTGDAFPNIESFLDALGDIESSEKQTLSSNDTTVSTNQTTITGKADSTDCQSHAGASGCDILKQCDSVDNVKVQKISLRDEIEKLSEENAALKDRRLCRICMDDEICIVFLKCGHFLCCAECAAAVKLCPACREIIRGTVRLMAPSRSPPCVTGSSTNSSSTS